MVTIKAQSSPQNAARYFTEHLSHDDYYSDRQQTAGRWFGRGCELLGIDSQVPVQQEDFTALCKGLRPDDRTRLTQRTVANRRCLYDITISAPKSLSIMALVAGDKRLIDVHQRAVAATLEVVESLAQARVRKGEAVDTKLSRQTGNIVCSRFLHQESRALDPQLHTHCVVFNVTHDSVEKRLKALEARPFYDRAKDLTQFYREQLGRSLRGLGYETYVDRHRCVQIRGISPELMAKFSKRSAQRDTLVSLKEKELGRRLTKGEVAKVLHENRNKKQRHADPETLHHAQLEQMTPQERLMLETLKKRALTPPRPILERPFTPYRKPAFNVEPGFNWTKTIRMALLAVRTLDFDSHMFSPAFSFPERVCYAARFLSQAQRTSSVLRYAQRNIPKGISR